MFERNTKIFLTTQLTHSLIFSIPIWIVFYQNYVTPTQLAVIVMLTYAVQMIMELPSGALADLIGRRTTLTISFLLGAISYLLIPFGTSYL
jgi:MFS family permease